MNAENIARALGGHRAGATWMACCPAHEDREPSLAISERGGMVLVHCHAGCEQKDVIAELRAKGLWSGKPEEATGKRNLIRTSTINHEQEEESRREMALALWATGKLAAGTLVESYLRSRGIQIAPPSRLRFHPALRHPSGGVLPAMIALVTRGTDDHSLGVHRTYLCTDGSGKAPTKPQKMMLGPCRGGVVRLGCPDNSLMIGEGIETCLSATQATGLPAWAALSTSGFRSLELPDVIDDVIVLADGDDAGEVAANACAIRLRRADRHIRIARPPAGLDFNDLLRTGGPIRMGAG